MATQPPTACAHPISASEKVSLGRSSVKVSRLGVGCSTFGGSLGRAMSDAAVSETVAAAFHAGLTYFDTAPHYGQGLSEKRLGGQLTNRSRDSFRVSTKVGISLIPGRSGLERGGLDFASTEPFESKLEFTRDAVAKSIEASLQRLKLERIDIIYIHDPDEAVTMGNLGADPYSKSHFSEVMRDVYPYLDELRARGIIGAIGIGINQWQMLRDFAREGDFDCFLLARQLTLIEHEGAVSGLLSVCQSRGVSIIAAGLFHNGILATGSAPADGSAPFLDVGPAGQEMIAKVKAIEAVCQAYDVPLQAAALQFPLRFACVAGILVGMRSADEVLQNRAWFEHQIPKEFWDQLQSAELIAENSA